MVSAAAMFLGLLAVVVAATAWQAGGCNVKLVSWMVHGLV